MNYKNYSFQNNSCNKVEYDKFINAPTGQELGKTLQGRGLAFDDILNNPDLATQLGNEFGYVGPQIAGGARSRQNV